MGISRKTGRKIVLAVIVAGITLTGFAISRWALKGQAQSGPGSSSFVVRRGDLTISVTESGTIKARNALEIKSQVEGRATIVDIVPEGSLITPEDVAHKKVLVELDSSRLRDSINQQQITFNSAEADYTEAKESLIIQKNQNDSDVQAGLIKVRFAKMDLQKYLGEETAQKMIERHKQDPNQLLDVSRLLDDPNQLGGESLQRYRQLTSNIDLQQEDLQRAERDLYWTRQLFEKKYIAESELKTDELKVKRLSVQWEQAKTSLVLFIRYEFLKEAEKYFSDYLEAERQLERIYAQTRSRLAQAKARLSSSEARYRLNKEQLERIEKQIEACLMIAEEPGLVIYASSDRSRWGGSRTNIEVGADIPERQLIMTVTNPSDMDVDVKVHETNIDKVRVGQPVNIFIDAQPDKMFSGKVLRIAPLPDPQSFFGNPDLKVYTTNMSLEGADESIRPGMSARVEVMIAQLEDVLSIPIQCVANRSGRKVCYVVTPDGPREQVVQTGSFTDRFVQILEGLQEGQQVLLTPPRLMTGSDKKTKTRTDTAEMKSDSPETSEDVLPLDTTDFQESRGEESENPAGEMDLMKRMDLNGDGKIDLSSEVPEQARSFLEPLDLNKDGFIDKAEMDAAAEKFGQRQGRPQGQRRSQRPQGSQRQSK